MIRFQSSILAVPGSGLEPKLSSPARATKETFSNLGSVFVLHQTTK